MKYVVAVALGALLIGFLLSLAVYFSLGADIGYFFAKFIAAPVGLICAFVLFIIYDSLWPKKRGKK